MSSPKLITIDELRKLLKTKLGLKKLSRASIYNWIKIRALPAPTEFGIPRKWRRTEIDEWVRQQIKGK
jgi:predicted DNA-binding transcriptional regulator AlpA